MEATVEEEVKNIQEQAAPPPRLRERYRAEIVPELIERFGYSSPMRAPRLTKITLNMGVGEASRTDSALDPAMEQLGVIAGQKPNIRRAKKSIAAFKIRDGMPIGAAVTLRRARMWEFLDRLITIAIPRIRDFRGLNPRSFDGRGNYSMGVREQLIFPEIDYDSIDEVRGLDVTITTTAPTDEEGFELLLRLGMPFAAEGRPGAVDEAAEEEEERRKEEARLACRGRAGGARAAQGGEPGGLRQARPRGRGGRGRRGGRSRRGSRRERPPRIRAKRTMAKTSQMVKQRRKPKFKTRRNNRCKRCGRLACLLPQVRPLPDLPARCRAQGLHPRHDQVELVGRGTGKCLPTR